MELTEELKEEILKHAQSNPEEEVCGLIIIRKGRYKYHPCKNISEVPRQCFMLAPDDYAKAEEIGEVVSVIHSHPYENPAPSEGDRVACEKAGVPWHIVNPQTEAWGYCEPEGFELPLIGRPFNYGIIDCYSLVRDWYKAELNIELRDYFRNGIWWENGENVYVDNFKNEGFHEVYLDEIKRGDVIMMQLEASVPNHLAVWLGCDQQIIHHLQNRLSSRDLYGGYYQKNTAKIVRHNSQ